MRKMFSEVEMARVVAISAQQLDVHSLDRQILRRLLQDLINETACKEHGFYLGVTALKSICINDHIEYNHQAQILTFRVSFTCRTFLPARGDFIQGVVKHVASNGVFIMSGPLRYAFLSVTKMPNYHYVESQSEGVEPCFQKDDLSIIAVGVVVRFEVLAVRFKERPHNRKNDVFVIATLEGGNTVGPVSLTGSDEPYM